MGNPRRKRRRTTISEQLAHAMELRQLIQFREPFGRATVRGYVAGIGPTSFALANVSDRIWFDGLEFFRVEDIPKVRPDPNQEFVEAALRLRSDQRPSSSSVSIGTVEELIRTANEAYPLVTVHREEVAPAVCHIGRVVGIADGTVSLLEINPDASWDVSPTTYQILEITRIGVGGDYENALYLVGGEPPTSGPMVKTVC